MKTGSTLTDRDDEWWGEPNVFPTSVSRLGRSLRVCASRVQKSSTSERALVCRRLRPAAEPGDSLLMSAANESSSARTDDGGPSCCDTTVVVITRPPLVPASSRLNCSSIDAIRSKLRPVGWMLQSNASFNNRRVAFCCSAVDDADKFSTTRAQAELATEGWLQVQLR